MAKLFGIIDIGSNSVRLMISDGDKSLKKYVNTTKLAEGLAKTGVLNDFAMERSLQAVCEFVQMAQKQNAQVHIFA
ncbi:MAG TPA: Ppx/GppA family phosphatase, partial [Clostridia bacterium]|nr:Ppx/GppA family phosphatase [Clostridia bacterium]